MRSASRPSTDCWLIRLRWPPYLRSNACCPSLPVASMATSLAHRRDAYGGTAPSVNASTTWRRRIRRAFTSHPIHWSREVKATPDRQVRLTPRERRPSLAPLVGWPLRSRLRWRSAGWLRGHRRRARRPGGPRAGAPLTANPPRDLIDDSDAARDLLVAEPHGPVLVDLAKHDAVDVDGQCVDRALRDQAGDGRDIARCAVLPSPPLEQRVQLGELARVVPVQDGPGLLYQLDIRDGLRVAPHRLRHHVRIAAHRPEDRVQWLGRGDHQGDPVPRQDLAQRVVDPPGILADPHLLALITLQPPYRRAVLDRRFARSSGNVAWHVRDPHERRRRIRDGLQQPHPALGEREYEGGLRERHRSHERLDVQPLAPDGQLNQPVRQPEGAQPGRGGKYRERSGLAAPKAVVPPRGRPVPPRRRRGRSCRPRPSGRVRPGPGS